MDEAYSAPVILEPTCARSTCSAARVDSDSSDLSPGMTRPTGDEPQDGVDAHQFKYALLHCSRSCLRMRAGPGMLTVFEVPRDNCFASRSRLPFADSGPLKLSACCGCSACSHSAHSRLSSSPNLSFLCLWGNCQQSTSRDSAIVQPSVVTKTVGRAVLVVCSRVSGARHFIAPHPRRKAEKMLGNDA